MEFEKEVIKTSQAANSKNNVPVQSNNYHYDDIYEDDYDND